MLDRIRELNSLILHDDAAQGAEQRMIDLALLAAGLLDDDLSYFNRSFKLQQGVQFT